MEAREACASSEARLALPVRHLHDGRRVTRIALIVMLVLLGCTRRDDPPRVETPARVKTQVPVETPSAPAAPIRTDRSSYVLTNGPQGPEATIVATLRA